MQRSEDRILTTHAGSLPRSRRLVELLVAESRHEPVDPAALQEAIDESTRRVVARQLAAGIDVGNDGEQARESFFTYVQHRMSGFGGAGDRAPFKDIMHFPSFRDAYLGGYNARPRVGLRRLPQAVGPVRYADRGPLEREVATYRRALEGQAERFVESFMTASSPGIIATAMNDAHYGSIEAYVQALAEALRTEYQHIAQQGYLLQIDCPDLAMERHVYFGERPLGDFLAFVELVVGAINRAIEGIPPEQVRLHVCWGNYAGPHIFDVPLDEVLPRLYRANVGALLIALANPRHAHEYHSFRRHPLPEGMLLIAGVVDTTTNYVEHPEVVAERIERVAAAVGDPRRVLAAPDCGFDTAAGAQIVAEGVAWEKLRALRAGADIAGARLFGVRPLQRV